MPITPVTLYFGLLLLILFYLILVQYTRFFTLPIFACKMSLNLHFYLVVLYTLCFFFCTLFAIADWYFSILAEIFIHQGEMLSKDLDSVLLENKQVDVSKTQKHEDTTAFSPNEKKQWFFVETLQKIAGDFGLKKIEKIHSSPTSNPDTLQAAKALYKGLSPVHSHPKLQGPVPPEALGITDLNNPDTEIPYFKRIHTLENGKKINIICFNGRAGFNAYNDIMGASVSKPSLTNFEQNCFKKFMWLQGLDETKCVEIKSIPKSELKNFFGFNDNPKPRSPTNRFDTTPGTN